MPDYVPLNLRSIIATFLLARSHARELERMMPKA
jgi:hypothetical protein